jgi:hypothetical protein
MPTTTTSALIRELSESALPATRRRRASALVRGLPYYDV